MAKLTNKKEDLTAQQKQIIFSLQEINLLEKFLEVPTYLDYSDYRQFQFKLEVDVNSIAAEKLLKIFILYQFKKGDKMIFSLKTENVFKIKNFTDAVSDGVPQEEISLYLVDLSIQHTRGVQSTIIKNTLIENLYIPYIQKEKILSKLRKKVIKE